MTDILPMTFDSVKQAAEAAVTKMGRDHRAPVVGAGCRYVIDECPSCIVGHIAAEHGYSIDTMKKWDAAQQNSGFSVDVLAQLGHLGTLDGRTSRFLAALQTTQDSVDYALVDQAEREAAEQQCDDEDDPSLESGLPRHTWGQALDHAVANDDHFTRHYDQ